VRQPKQSGIVLLMVLLSILTYFDRHIIAIAGPGIIKEFSISETQMGTVYSAYLLSYSLLMIPGGWFADLFGPRLVLTVMALGSALLTGLTALGGKPGLGAYIGIVPSFIVIRLAMGICAAPTYPTSAKMNANWIPVGYRGRTWGWISCGAGIGGACSPLIFAWLIAHYGWRGGFCVAAVASAALGLLWYWYVRDHPAEPGQASSPGKTRIRTPWKDLFRNRDLMLLTAGYFTANYFEYIFFYWLYYYFGQIRHMGMEQSAIYTTLMWLAWTVMTPIGGIVSDRMVARYGSRKGRRIVPMAGLALSAVLVVIGANVSGTLPTVVLLCLSLGFASSSDGPYWAAAIEASGKYAGAGGGIFNTGGNLGGLLAPTVTPLIASWLGWEWGLYAGGLVVLVGVSAWFFIGTGSTVVSHLEARETA
jgi:MFS family permease